MISINSGRDGKHHKRDLDWDVHSFKERGVDAVFCLLGRYELRSIGVDSLKYAKACEKETIELNTFEIVEMSAPEKEEVGKFKEKVVKRALENLENSKNILIHCRGGIGRASTVAACILGHIYKDAKADDIIKMLRRRRDKRAVESYKQAQFIRNYFKGICLGVTEKKAAA